uniref:Farnesoic acid O-methyl transferase domain-containing protein n=1 Tax=Magallana gigas TaxID=29159 RepID=A0A8W8LG21_MAGGI
MGGATRVIKLSVSVTSIETAPCIGVQTNLIFDQGTWKVIDSMYDVYTNSSVLSSHQDVTCIECAARTLMLDGEGYSCNRGDQMCMIYSTCHLKDRLVPGDWEPMAGWLHFCTKIKLAPGLTGTWLDLGIQLSRRKSIRFQVKATNDVYIGLGSGHNTDSPGYWVVLGGWDRTTSCLRDGFVVGSQCYSEYIGPVLSGKQYRSFWVTWNEGHVRVGTGETVGNGTIMDHVFPNVYTVRHALIKTYKCRGEWVIYL